MAEIVRMPKMSDTMTEGVIAKWHKKVGDTVKSGELMAEIETDKATMDYESFNSGTVLYLGAQEGQAVPIDGILAVVGSKGEDYAALLAGAKGAAASGGQAAAPKEEPAKQAAPSEKIDTSGIKAKIVQMPKMSDTMTEGVNGVLAIIGEKNADWQTLLKAFQSNAAGGAKPVAEASSKETPAASTNSSQPVATAVAEHSSSNGRLKASPLAKKIAKDKGLDINQVQGTGDHGRITKHDVENFKPSATPAAASSGKAGAAPVLLPQVVGQESFEDIPLSQMRKVIAKRLAESMYTAPHFYVTMEINMDKSIEARKSINEISPVKISFNDMVIKATAAALRQHPDVNVGWLGDKIRRNKHIHIGVAVAVKDGLVVPVVRFADNKSLSHIGAEVKELAQRAHDNKLQPAEMEGGTFAISNLGMFGVEEFTAIINPPNACILAVGGIKETPIIKNGQVVAGNIMKVTLSSDHRAVDGAVASAFLKTLKGLLEDPVRILI